jgi:hypothetical protein
LNVLNYTSPAPLAKPQHVSFPWLGTFAETELVPAFVEPELVPAFVEPELVAAFADGENGVVNSQVACQPPKTAWNTIAAQD